MAPSIAPLPPAMDTFRWRPGYACACARSLRWLRTSSMPAHDGALQFPGRIGLGTWEMGVEPGQRPQEIAAVKHALDVGYRVLDTAEMYADGGAERIIGGALQAFGAARRAELCIVSKVLPGNASRSG